jgi:hypothetical protein
METPMNKYKVYTGPTLVNGVAQRMMETGQFAASWAGTEHVYLETYLGYQTVLDLLQKPYGTGFTQRDLVQINS